MRLAECIRSQREMLGIEARQLSFMSGITQSTISRIESSKIDPTIETVYKLISVLGLDIFSFQSLLRADSKNDNPNILNLTLDAQSYLSQINNSNNNQYINRSFEFPTIIDLHWIYKEATRNFQNIDAILCGLLNKAIQAFYNRQNPSQIDTNVYINLKTSNYFLTNTPIIDYSIKYPSDVNEGILVQILSQSGAISIEDLLSYVETKLAARNSSKLNPFEEDVIEKLKYMYITNKSIEKMKFSTLLDLEKYLSGNGIVFLMGWKSIEYQQAKNALEEKPFSVNGARLFDSFLFLSRWLALEGIRGTWLSDIKVSLGFKETS